MRAIIGAFARNLVFANILLSMIFLLGALGATHMVREVFPRFSLDVIMITVPWPGSDPAEVEEGVCRKIEEAIEGLDGIKRYNSTASENFGSVLIEVAEGFDVDYVKDRVRNKVDSIPNFPPPDAESATVEEVVFRNEVLYVALHGDGLNEKDLKEWGERVKEDLRNKSGISQVQLIGDRDYEIAIEVSEERLREYGLSLEQVRQAVRASNLNLAGGTVRTEGEEIRLRTIGRKYTGEELAKIVLFATPQGDVITLDRVATIQDQFTQDQLISRFNGHPAVMVGVMKTEDEDAIEIAGIVREYVQEQRGRLAGGINLDIWADSSRILAGRIDLLVRNGIIGLILVFGLLWLFLDIRLSFWVGMGMPISVAGALAIMWMVGATINMISLFGLIMVLGIIVDDAIIVGEAIYVARKNGAPPLRAAIEGVMEVGMSVVAAVTTTIVAFLPLLYVRGIMGKFISILPVVVISCLLISLVECLMLLPAHLSHLPDPNIKRKRANPLIRFGDRFHHLTNHSLEWFVDHVYHPFVEFSLRWRYAALALALGIVFATVGAFKGGIIKSVFFPNVDSDIITASIEFPDGTPLSVTSDAIRRLEEALERVVARTPEVDGHPLLQNMYSVTGTLIADNDLPKFGNNIGSVRVELLPTQIRNIPYEKIMVDWEKEVGIIPGIEALSFNGIETGPPGAAIEIWVQGHDYDQILAAADAVKDQLGTFDGTYQIQHDFRPGKPEMRLELKDDARTLGLTVADLARQVYAGYFGDEAVRLQRGRDDVRVRVRYPDEDRRQVSEFENMRIRTPQGMEVPLLSVANVTYGPGFSTITRTDGMRRAMVTCEVDSARANTNEIVADIEAGFFPKLRDMYPDVRVSLQGQKKESEDSIASLMVTYPIALLGIFIIIATIFRSYVQPVVIMLAIPFGIVGAILGHLFLGYEVSIMSIFGIVALSGVVVNDAIVLIECINENLASGLPLKQAIREGGKRRFRAIILTTLSTVGGLTPLILEKDMQAQFLIPMAVSLAAGVAFSTILTLILVPCFIAALNDLRRITHWLIHREWVAPEEVEPARYRRHDPDDLATGPGGEIILEGN